MEKILRRKHKEKRDYSKRRGNSFVRKRGLAKTEVTRSPSEGPPIVENPKLIIQIDCEPNYR